MAPNRKQVTTLLPSPTDLSNLHSTLQPKFLPLTHPQEEQQCVQRQQEEEQTKASAESIASYWDWPADIPVEEIKKDLFSVAHLESNLIQAANSIPVSAESSSTLAANDDYWAEESCSGEESKLAATKPQHLTASYWDWGTTTPMEEKQATIQKIVQEDKAHRIVSVSLQVQPVVATNSEPQSINTKSSDPYWLWESPVTAPHALDVNHPLANYWDEATDSDKTMLQQIIEYEHARQVLTAAHMVQLLMQHPVTSTCSVINNVSSEDYWSWSEPLGDAYWDTTKTTAIRAVASGGCADYWDM